MTTEMNLTPHAGMRPVIAIAGKRNAGKSLLLNVLTGQEVSIVSDVLGTTTDAVCKTYELIPAGAVSFYDTAGLDDTADDLGKSRVKASEKILKKADLILYVIGKDGLDGTIEEELRKLNLEGRAFIPVFNFCDEVTADKYTKAVAQLYGGCFVSAKTGVGVEELKQKMAEMILAKNEDESLLRNLVTENDTVVLVTPIDLAAPKGRLIMPQVQVLRETLDLGAQAYVTKENALAQTLKNLHLKPALVITDSQAVKKVAELVPQEVALTTFSMLFSRQKGNFEQQMSGAFDCKNLKDDDTILIVEGCSHRQTCDDIGRVKIPALMQKYTGKKLNFEFCSGGDFPDNLSRYALVVHCGGCVLNKKEIRRRLDLCKAAGIPATNYGMVISLAQGVLERTAAPLLKK